MVAILETVYEHFPLILGGEGFAPFMYLDANALVTTGEGDLIDPIERALDPSLHWLNDSDGSPATPDQVRQSWLAVKSRTDLVPKGGWAFKGIGTVHLSDANIKAFVDQTARSYGKTLESLLPSIGSFPADAQGAILRWAWAVGPNAWVSAPEGHVPYTKMRAALSSSPPDFITANQESAWGEENADTQTLISTLFHNAVTVQANGWDPTVWWYPNPPASGSGGEGGDTGGGSLLGNAAQAVDTLTGTLSNLTGVDTPPAPDSSPIDRLTSILSQSNQDNTPVTKASSSAPVLLWGVAGFAAYKLLGWLWPRP